LNPTDDFLGSLWWRELAAELASYNPVTSHMRFTYENPGAFSIPYNITEGEFEASCAEIKKATTWFHEFVHYLQGWSTTAGITHALLLSSCLDQILHMARKPDVGPPISEHFDRLIAGGGPYSDSEAQFLSIYLGLGELLANWFWFLGSTPPRNRGVFSRDKYRVEVPETFYTADVMYLGRPLTGRTGGGAKRCGLFNYFGVELTDDDALFEHCIAVGSRHLMECFAKSVEFEHLLSFNSSAARRIIGKWIDDNESMTYNAAFRLMTAVGERTSTDRRQINWPWAHLRIFIDIALMYGDLLNATERDFSRPEIIRTAASEAVQPGVTFARVVRAFGKCSPLTNHYEDVLRLYDDLCHVLGIPSQEAMTGQLLEVANLIAGSDAMQQAITKPYYDTAVALLQERQKDPRLFINDIISPKRCSELASLLEGRLAVFTPSGVTERDDRPAGQVEVAQRFAWQLLSKDTLTCPIDELLREVGDHGRPQRECMGSRSRDGECETCGWAEFVDQFLWS
jgi:hypothetical protein